MAGLGAKKFLTNELLTSADANGYLSSQVIMRFADAAARDAAFGGAGEFTLAEGMTCYLDDTNVLQTYTGSAWAEIGCTDGSPRGVVGAAARITNFTLSNASVFVPDTSVTFTALPTRLYKLTSYTYFQITGGSGSVFAGIFVTSTGQRIQEGGNYGTAGSYASISNVAYVSGITGSYTFQIKAQFLAGGITAANTLGDPGYPTALIIEDIGVA
jgi:hypothetical protein